MPIERTCEFLEWFGENDAHFANLVGSPVAATRSRRLAAGTRSGLTVAMSTSRFWSSVPVAPPGAP